MGFGADLAAGDLRMVGRLGDPIGYTPVGGPTVTPLGIFDRAYAAIDAGNHASVTGSHPAVFFRLADLPSDPEVVEPSIELSAPFEATVQGVYSVAEIHKDGVGGVVLVLQKA